MKTTFTRVYWLTCVLLTAIASAVSATTIVMPTDEQLVQKSPVIVRGVVVSSMPVDRNGAIWTETILQVDAVLKGDVPSAVTIREIGGILGDRITKVWGAPEYTAGEHVLAFLTPTRRGDFQTMDLFVGKFSEAQTVNGERLWMRSGDAADVTLLDSSFHAIPSTTSQRDAGRFEQFVADRVGGAPGAQNYGVENPAVAAPAGGGRLQIAPDFTLIAEPTVYRWSGFDSGSSVSWRAYGTQPGYSGGGINEFNTGMSSWTSYAAANIRYTYAGTFNGPPGGNTTPNGVNEVDFNDPNGEISGSWNPSTGGVVGQGGFNGVAGQTNWTAPFTADATHTQQTYRAYTITEGNLVIQDGVSPSAGISSTILAQIIAHELGHTLGFGHSADPTALMYANVTGRGPALQADDQLAARWLYPSGNSTPPPGPSVPAAPTALSAVPASSTTATLKWTDNSTNESGFHIYFGQGASGGSFSNIGDVGAGAQSATITGLAAGTFRFYVTAFNSAGESAASNTATLTIGTATQPVNASFAVSTTTGVAGATTFAFTDQSTGPVASRTWNFGDGTTSAATSPAHMYGTAGTYTVFLTVRDSAGNSSQASVNITVTSAPLPQLQAAFSFSPANPVAGDSVSFADQSTGGVTSWVWSFGDGSVSSQQNPSKMYASAGTYSVTLTAYRNADSSVASQTVVVGSKSPVLPPPPSSFQSLVPVTAQTNGAGGSIWRTEFTLFNAGSETASVDLTFVPGAGTAAQTRSIALLPRETRTYANVLLDAFGMPNNAGGIAINATGATTTPDLRVSSRTFAATPNGTYGQAVPDVDSSDLQTTSYLTGIISNADFRTNIGVVNKSSNAVPTTLVLLDGAGRIVQTASLSVGPNSFQQASLGTYFPSTTSGSYPILSLRVSTQSANAVSVYASVVDNRTQDPVYIQAAPVATSGPITLPVVARANGANGTFWRSDVTVFNPNTSTQSVSLTFDSGTGAQTRTVNVGAGAATVLSDIVGSFGQTSGSGPVDVRWTGATAPVVTSRTYTTAANGGTYGQSVDIAGAFGSQQYVTGLRSDASFRTNIGFVNNGSSGIPVHATVLSASGAPLGSMDVWVNAHSLVQVPLASAAPGVDPASIGSCTLQATTGGAATLFVYGSVVDNSTGDPVLFAGR